MGERSAALLESAVAAAQARISVVKYSVRGRGGDSRSLFILFVSATIHSSMGISALRLARVSFFFDIKWNSGQLPTDRRGRKNDAWDCFRSS